MVPKDVTTLMQRGEAGVSVGLEAFDGFVAARSTALLRTAYLLTHDRALAEDLLQTALTKAWFSWERIEGRPEAYVRKILVNTYSTWWRRKWTPGIREGGPAMNLTDRRDELDAAVEACFSSEDYAEGRLAFKEKRKPRFKGR